MKNVDPPVLTPGPQKWLDPVELKNFDLSGLEDIEKSKKNQPLSLNLHIKCTGVAASPPNPFYHVRVVPGLLGMFFISSKWRSQRKAPCKPFPRRLIVPIHRVL